MGIKDELSGLSEMGKLFLVAVSAATIAKLLDRLLDSLMEKKEPEGGRIIWPKNKNRSAI